MRKHECKNDESLINDIKNRQVDEQMINEMSEIFKMYGDPTRLKILNSLFKQELCVLDIVEICEVSQSAISHQLAKLKANRIIKSRKEGKNVYYSLDDRHIELIFNNCLEHVSE